MTYLEKNECCGIKKVHSVYQGNYNCSLSISHRMKRRPWFKTEGSKLQRSIRDRAGGSRKKLWEMINKRRETNRGMPYCCNQATILICNMQKPLNRAGFLRCQSEMNRRPHNNSILIISSFMHTVAHSVLSSATNTSIQRWYNKTTCGWCGSHYSTNELSPWQSDLSANEASRPCARGAAQPRVSKAAACDEGPACST